MSDDEALRGSSPVYTAKDILQKLDRKVDAIDEKMDTQSSLLAVLASQHLNDRLSAVEKFQNRIAGLAILGPLLAAGAAALALLGVTLR